MGYPGQTKDEVMDRVRELRNLAEGRHLAVGDPGKLSEIDDRLDELEREISELVASDLL